MCETVTPWLVGVIYRKKLRNFPLICVTPPNYTIIPKGFSRVRDDCWKTSPRPGHFLFFANWLLHKPRPLPRGWLIGADLVFALLSTFAVVIPPLFSLCSVDWRNGGVQDLPGDQGGQDHQAGGELVYRNLCHHVHLRGKGVWRIVWP